MTTSRPSTASRGSRVVRAASPAARTIAANRSALAAERLQATTSFRPGKTRRSASKWLRACTPQPTKPIETLSARASACAAIAVIAAVRVAVIQLPPITATVAPVLISDSTIRLLIVDPLLCAAGTRPSHFIPARPSARITAGLAWNTWPGPIVSTDFGAACAVPRACAAKTAATASRKRASDISALATSTSDR